MTQVNYSIPDDLHKKAKLIAQLQGKSLRYILVRALSKYCNTPSMNKVLKKFVEDQLKLKTKK